METVYNRHCLLESMSACLTGQKLSNGQRLIKWPDGEDRPDDLTEIEEITKVNSVCLTQTV